MLWKLDQNELVVEISQLIAKGALAMQAVNASINIEQHGHVKVRSLRQWRPVFSRYGMRGVRVGEASNPGPVTTRSARRVLATQVDSSGIEQERDLGSGRLTRPVDGRDVRPRRGHRRGLVVEVAPNVVDATAVDMSNSPDESDDDLELDLPVDDEFVFNWIESDEEEDHDEEATLLDALEKDLVGSPEVPATQVDPTALGFAPEDGSGSRGQSPTILGTSMDPESASVRQDAQPPSDGEDELPVWSLAKRSVHPSAEQEDFKVRTQNRFEVLVPQEICNVKPELEAFDLTMADSDTESVEVPPPQNHRRVPRKF